MRRSAVLVVAALLGIVVTGCSSTTEGPPAAAAQPPPAVSMTDPGHAAGDERVSPVHVTIPAIGVDSTLVDLGTDATGALVPPQSAAVAGWYSAGPAPGQDGPALLAGHVDSRSGPGVFFRLGDLHVGDRIAVQRSDGTSVAFIVSRLLQSPKTDFPTDLVYAPTPAPELRLVTCGGSFDRSIRSYRDNIVVEAVSADDGSWTID